MTECGIKPVAFPRILSCKEYVGRQLFRAAERCATKQRTAATLPSRGIVNSTSPSDTSARATMPRPSMLPCKPTVTLGERLKPFASAQAKKRNDTSSAWPCPVSSTVECRSRFAGTPSTLLVIAGLLDEPTASPPFSAMPTALFVPSIVLQRLEVGQEERAVGLNKLLGIVRVAAKCERTSSCYLRRLVAGNSSPLSNRSLGPDRTGSCPETPAAIISLQRAVLEWRV